MYYAPRHFRAEEMFPKKVVEDHTHDGKLDMQIWRLMDPRVTWTMDALRDQFGTMVMNDYLWGGKNQYRGYRPVLELLNIAEVRRSGKLVAKFSSFTSQHCFGRASDSVPTKVTVDEIREDIRKNPNAFRYRYITCVEDGVSWLHFDTRLWDRKASGILFIRG